MDKNDIKNRIEFLRNEINIHNHNYYVLSNPSISDKEFDMLLRELEDLEKANPEFYDAVSPTQRVGSDISEGFKHITHERPMMSLSNTYSIDEVDEWFNRVSRSLNGEKFQVVGELKFDGTSISIIYRNGQLVRAVTRGDGTQGDDVTANVKAIRSIPLQLLPGDWPEEFEIRGEILMPWVSFEKLNADRIYNEEQPFANPRNAASGTLKLLDPKEVSRRHLDARFYYVLGEGLSFNSHYESMEAARRWGFKVSNNIKILTSLKEVDDFVEYWDSERKTIPVATDGLVFKVDDLRQQLNLGMTAKSPRWAVAFKFNPENASTPLRFVTFETGRMGVITPVANLEPVLLSGTIVKRASLHNEDIIRQLDIHQGDWVYVEKGGEIIPKITGVALEKRDPNAERIQFVKVCQECGTPLVKVEGEAAWKCPNVYGCRPQLTGKIEHFCARRMMNIDGIGEETAMLLYDAGLVRNIADLYSLTENSLASLDRIGTKTARKILKGVEDSKQIPFEKVIYALSIPNVGETTSKRLATAVKSMDALMEMSVEELTECQDIGPIIAKSIYDFLRQPINIRNIETLRENGVKMSLSEEQLMSKGNALEGKQIVISGTFIHHSRDEYKAIIEREGGKNVSSISKKTTFVLAGENMGPSKKTKCESLGVPMISEEEFLNIFSKGENE
jgi:DNA ligase (NAD+)